jgi:Na+-driven multidrug efflux pump
MSFSTIKKRLIGDRAFYAMVLAVAVPMVLQDGITTFVGLLDNVMVGRTGTEQMSGVAITNQLMMIYNLCIFGGLSGAGIFAAQFFGHSDMEGLRNAFRCKLYIAL